MKVHKKSKIPKNKKKFACRICNAKQVDVIIKLADIPLPEIYEKLSFNAKKHKNYKYRLGRCKNCKHIQLIDLIDKKVLWKNYTYFSGQTETFRSHFKETSKIIKRFCNLKEADLVIDIGSNDGEFLKNFKKTNNVLGIDPAKNLAKYAWQKNRIKTLVAFFDNNIAKKIELSFGKAKVILAFNVFAHTPSMSNFVKNVKNLLDDDGYFVFESQYLGDIIKKNILGTFFHEHISHHSVYSLNKLFNKYGLYLEHVIPTNVQEGSIIGFVSKRKIKKNISVKKFLLYEKKYKINTIQALKKFETYIKDKRETIKKLIRNYKSVSAFGAARSGPTIMKNYGFEKYVNYIFDDHVMKRGRFTPVSSIKILETSKILKIRPDLIIITAYLYAKQIIRKNLNYLKSNGSFLIIHPKVQIINKNNFMKFIN